MPSDPVKLELQAVVSPMWALGTEPAFSLQVVLTADPSLHAPPPAPTCLITGLLTPEVRMASHEAGPQPRCMEASF